MTPVKKTTKKAETVKAAPAAETAVEKTAAPAAPAAPEAEKKTKKAPARKAAPKKVAEAPKKEAASKKAEAPAASVTIEFAGRQFAAKEVLEKACSSYKAGHKDAEIKTIDLYIQPEQNVAYYVVNGEGSEDYKVEL